MTTGKWPLTPTQIIEQVAEHAAASRDAADAQFEKAAEEGDFPARAWWRAIRGENQNLLYTLHMLSGGKYGEPHPGNQS